MRTKMRPALASLALMQALVFPAFGQAGPPAASSLQDISGCSLEGDSVLIVTGRDAAARRYKYPFDAAIDALCNAKGYAIAAPPKALAPPTATALGAGAAPSGSGSVFPPNVTTPTAQELSALLSGKSFRAIYAGGTRCARSMGRTVGCQRMPLAFTTRVDGRRRTASYVARYARSERFATMCVWVLAPSTCAETAGKSCATSRIEAAFSLTSRAPENHPSRRHVRPRLLASSVGQERSSSNVRLCASQLDAGSASGMHRQARSRAARDPHLTRESTHGDRRVAFLESVGLSDSGTGLDGHRSCDGA